MTLRATATATMCHCDLDQMTLHVNQPNPIPKTGEVLIRGRVFAIAGRMVEP